MIKAGLFMAALLLLVAAASCSDDADGPSDDIRSSVATATTSPPPADPSREPSAVPSTVVADVPAASTPEPPPAIVLQSIPTTIVAPTVVAVTHLVYAATIPLRERIALLVWPAVYSNDWDTAASIVEEHRVGGVVLMRPNGWGPDDVGPQLARLKAATPRGLIIAIDEEGGEVQRLSLLGRLGSQQFVSEHLDPAQAQQLIAEHGALLANVGVDMVLGPVIDVVPRSGVVPLDRSRFFTGDAATVEAYAAAYVAGWSAGGVAAVLKHYPGHGAAAGDTHVGPGVTPELAELEGRDLVPFRGLADSGAAVMVGHLTVPGLTGDAVATQSGAAIRYLRDDLGYGEALVMTDALGMQAVGLPEEQAAVLALVAGIDVVIFTETNRTAAVIDAIEQAVADGTLSEGEITISAARVLRLLQPDPRDCLPMQEVVEWTPAGTGTTSGTYASHRETWCSHPGTLYP